MKKIAVNFITIIFLSSSALSQWSEQPSGLTTTLYSISALNDSIAWTCGASGKVLRTTNGGANWILTNSPNQTLNLYQILVFNDSLTLVTGSTTTTYIYRTTNNGNTWQETFTQPGGFINGIVRINATTIGATGDPVGGRWTLPASHDFGITWDTSGFPPVPQVGNETGWNNAMILVSCKSWMGTNNSRMYHAPNCQQPPNLLRLTSTLVNSMSVWTNDNLTVIAGGEAMIRSTDGGNNWSSISSPGSGNILGITGSGNSWCYVRSNKIYVSFDNGNSWTEEHTSPAGNYNHVVKARTGNRMWAVRTNGGISKSDGFVGIKPVNDIMPEAFVLHQNYPNPFNPVTTIMFELPKTSAVTIKVYDINAKLTETLVDEDLSAGIYCVDLNAKNYSSGVYTYQLSAVSGTKNITQTKRMVLIK